MVCGGAAAGGRPGRERRYGNRDVWREEWPSPFFLRFLDACIGCRLLFGLIFLVAKSFQVYE